MTIVVDPSFVVAALLDGGADGTWADSLLAGDHLAAPHLMPAEVADILRRSGAAGDVSADIATLAHADLLGLPVDLFAYEPFAERVWQLRDTVTAYDAWYVALAEALDSPLATLDVRLGRATGPRCTFLTPPATTGSAS